MADLIDRQAAIETVRKAKDKSEAHRMIIQLPNVDAVPVKHGRWKMVEGELAFWDMCSVCGRKILHRTPYYDFCPNCGADMRKDCDKNG